MVGVLSGFTVGITGDRRADEQAELLRRRGANVLHGPMIETVSLVDGPELGRASEGLVAEPPDVLVANTGVGMRSWLEAADGIGLGDRLRAVLGRTEVLARGPKSAGAAVTLGLHVDWQAPGERSEDVVAYLTRRDLRGVRVAVQRDGAEEASLAGLLAAAGADVVDVPVYRWTLPSDPGPAHRLLDAIVGRQLDALTITSSPALSNLLHLAGHRDDWDDLSAALTSEDILVACVGPVCAGRAREAGITNTLQPDRYRLGAMVKVLAVALAATRWSLRTGAVELIVQGTWTQVNSTEVDLSRREAQLLARLAAARGAVVSKPDLARTVWHHDIDPHVVEVTVARLRQRLGTAASAIVTVPRRGYRLAAEPTWSTRTNG